MNSGRVRLRSFALGSVLLAGCSGSGVASGDELSQRSSQLSSDELPDCDEALDGRLVYVSDLDELQFCREGRWQSLDLDVDGDVGAKGEVGPAGAPGPAGATGADGATGSQGADGQTGAVGQTGTLGRGPTGGTGESGSLGDIGAQGSVGSTGSVGVDGAIGATGAAGVGRTGPTGPAGAIGDEGPSGPTGPTETSGTSGYTYCGSSDLVIPPDGGLASDSIVVPDIGNVVGVSIRLAVSHPYVSDVRIELVHGSSTVFFLQGICPDDGRLADLDATFSDAGYGPLCSSPVGGHLLPAEPFSLFAGADAAGTWTINFSDGFPAEDDGTLSEWCMYLTVQAP
jgi:hypothetical protein